MEFFEIQQFRISSCRLPEYGIKDSRQTPETDAKGP